LREGGRRFLLRIGLSRCVPPDVPSIHTERSMHMGRRKRILHGAIAVLSVGGLLLAAGCATRNYRGDYSRQLLSQGEKAVSGAKAGNASQSAQAELKASEEKLALARDAFAKEEYGKAGRLAEEAAVAAEYAQARAETEKNRKAAEEVRKNLEAMRQDIERQSQSK